MFLFLFGCTTTNNQSLDDKKDDSQPIPITSRATQIDQHQQDVVRFIAMGDGGEGNDAQYKNAASIAKICEVKTDIYPGCSFALYLGDNFYDEGVEGIDDQQFQDKFERPYANLDFPFYAVLGNHDYGGCVGSRCGTGWDFNKANAQIEYTKKSTKWNMPAAYYDFIEDHVHFFALDTNAILWDPWLGTANKQPSWLAAQLVSSKATWKIVFGHHPYISNGRHGNAGSYEGLNWSGPILPVPAGIAIKNLFDDHICQHADLYLSGHDHNRQWLYPTCNTEFIVSGAAAKTTPLASKQNNTRFQTASIGFLWVEIVDNCLRGEFYDHNGKMDFTHEVCK